MKSPVVRLPLVMLVGLLGCAERTMVRSSPPDAKVYLGDRFVGITPTLFRVPREEMKDTFVLRVERDGYQSQEVTVPTQIAAGRIVGGIFTLGITLLFRGPTALPRQVDVDLRPSGRSSTVTSSAVPTLTPATAKPTPASETYPTVNLRAEQRLRQLEDLHGRGLITEQEYRRYRAEILHGL